MFHQLLSKITDLWFPKVIAHLMLTNMADFKVDTVDKLTQQLGTLQGRLTKLPNQGLP